MNKPPPVSLLFGDGNFKVFLAAVHCAEVPLVPGKGLQGFRDGTSQASQGEVPLAGVCGRQRHPVEVPCLQGLSPGSAGGLLAVIILAMNVHESCCENTGAEGW